MRLILILAAIFAVLRAPALAQGFDRFPEVAAGTLQALPSPIGALVSVPARDVGPVATARFEHSSSVASAAIPVLTMPANDDSLWEGALIGGLVGTALFGGTLFLVSGDMDEWGPILRFSIMGAVLGGSVGAAIDAAQ